MSERTVACLDCDVYHGGIQVATLGFRRVKHHHLRSSSSQVSQVVQLHNRAHLLRHTSGVTEFAGVLPVFLRQLHLLPLRVGVLPPPCLSRGSLGGDSGRHLLEPRNRL